MHMAKGTSNASYWYITLLVVILAGLAATAYVIVTTSNSIKASLIQRTDSMAELIPANNLTILTGSEQDLASPTYSLSKRSLVSIRESNNDIRFIYILGLRYDQKDAFFYLDSEPPESEDYSYPGQSYNEGLEDVKTTVSKKQSWVLPIEQDRWGTWLSAFSPIYNQDGSVAGVLGMDVPARHYYQSIALTAAVPLLLTFTVVMGLIFARRRAIAQQNFLNQKAFYLSFASHEIVSPLTSVAWAIREKTSTAQNLLPKIQASISEVLSTVQDVLSLQNLDRLGAKKLKKEPTNISALIDTLITNLAIVCEEHQVHIQNHTHQKNKKFAGMVDALLFKRVLFNLLINAVKYSPKHGIVTAELTQNTKTWTVSIHNDGQSISLEDQKRIFEGFYRTQNAESSNQQGIGLGLMLSHDIIARHGGELQIVADADKGVTFKIVMPKSN
jgi:signal transduction histidine kinase